MSEYGEGDDTLDETTAAANNSANNSIIGKVRTGVTSILPNSLSKWFSPSTSKSESASNGNKRRHNDDENASTPTVPQRRIFANHFNDDDDGLEGEREVDESNVRTSAGLSSFVQPRRSLNTSKNEEPPPTKRCRMTLDGSMLNSRPLVASTPAVSVQRTMSANSYGRFSSSSVTRTPNKRSNEPGYNFFTATASGTDFEQQNTSPDIIDLYIPMSSGSNELPETNNNQLTQMEPSCSRRNLNIPTSTAALGYSKGDDVNSSLKRQASSNIRRSTKTQPQQPTENNNILGSDIHTYENKDTPVSLDPALELDEVVLQGQSSYNGQVQSKFQNGNDDEFVEETESRQNSPSTDSDVEENDLLGDLPIKRARHLAAGSLRTDTSMAKKRQLQQQQQQERAAPTGLFNMSLSSSVNNSRNGSRTSSFGNGLNFDTHLEGRKSLFAGGSRVNVKTTLANSTLSLNSLSRRQFNASIYGSTSALSDSRLLNATTSPFYKGNTTYGGAAAYRKYPTPARLTPTMMRPLSSLSTLSSSNNSLAGERAITASSTGASPAPVLSGSAKYIYDALNDMTTPLLDAKKMASSLQHRQQTGKSSEVYNTPALAGSVSLQQVSKPYTRPTVMLRPKHTSKATQQTLPLPPPIRELQVPSMSQLLTMKKQLQNSTERSRQIAMQKATNQSYTIQTTTSSDINSLSSWTSTVTKTTATTAESSVQPTTSQTFTSPASNSSESKLPQLNFDALENIKKTTPFSEVANEANLKHQQQQKFKHVNKIRHKINSIRTAPDCMENEPSLLPVDLPQITFPVMKEMPKIDFGFSPATTTTASTVLSFSKTVAESSKATAESNIDTGFKFSPPARITDTSLTDAIAPASMNFKFCEPVSLGATKRVPTTETSRLPLTNTTTVPALKTGSCLDALKTKPAESLSVASTAAASGFFGQQFKKVEGEWDCDSCMVRNKPTAQKCVACETPRKAEGASKTTSAPPPPPPVSSGGFGGLFKKQAGEWECDACMLRNKPEATKCVSCETARKTTNESSVAKSINAINDTGFKAIADAQKSSSWECDACMTRNDAARLKCACCEQAKPGSVSSSQHSESIAPKFSFGTTAAAKFSFGFGAGNESELRAKTSTEATTLGTTTLKTTSSTTGFTFGIQQASVTTAPSKGFTFGLAAGQTQIPESKDASDGKEKPKSGFTFGIGTPTATAIATSSVTTTTTTKSTTGEAPTTTLATTTTSTSTSTASVAPFSFGSPTTKASTTTVTTTSNPLTLANNKPAFTFGLTQTQKSTENNIATVSTTLTIATTTTSTSATTNTFGGQQAFSFGVKAATTTAPSLPSFNMAANTKPMLNFGATKTTTSSSSTVAAVSTTTKATTANSGFGSGSGSNFKTSSTPIFGATSASTNATAPTTTAAPTFGSFSSPKISNLQTENSNNTTTISTSSSASTPFVGFSFGAAKTENNPPKLFGTPSTVPDSQIKPIAPSTQMFGNATTTTVTTATNLISQNATTTSTPLSAISSTWPNSSPLFSSMAQKQDTAPKTVFGNFNSNTSAMGNANTATSSLFGSIASATTPAFGSSNVAVANAFGASANASTGTNNNNNLVSNTPNLFGSSTTGNATATAAPATLPQFGSGNAASPLTFGSSSGTFGGFGSAAAQQPSNVSNTNTQPNVATPFQFGAPAINSGGFNFGATAAARPAFNFTSNNQQPSFNFTGSSTESNQNASRPFQFGAPAATVATSFGNPTTSTPAMVFNFGGAQTTSESNALFQFSAGNPPQHPQSTNIFAPPASNTTQSSAAARRRVRVPNRRLTPR